MVRYATNLMLPAGKSASAATYVSEMTSAIHLALAHLCSLASDSSVHRKNFSRDIVACMLEDLWPDVMQAREQLRDGLFLHFTNVIVECFQALQYLLIDRHDPVATEPAIAAVTLNMLKYASSACLFLGLSDQVFR